MKIDIETLRILDNAKISWEDYLLLSSKIEIDPMYQMYAKKLLFNSEERVRMLIRRGYLDSEGTPTKMSTDLFGGKVLKVSKKVKSQMEKYKEGFDTLWKTYPSTDKYRHWGKTRILRRSSDRCFKYYLDAMKKYTVDELQQSLEYNIKLVEKASVSENKFLFFPLITTWFKEAHYEGLIEDLKENSTVAKIDNKINYEGEIK